MVQRGLKDCASHQTPRVKVLGPTCVDSLLAPTHGASRQPRIAGLTAFILGQRKPQDHRLTAAIEAAKTPLPCRPLSQAASPGALLETISSKRSSLFSQPLPIGRCRVLTHQQRSSTRSPGERGLIALHPWPYKSSRTVFTHESSRWRIFGCRQLTTREPPSTTLGRWILCCCSERSRTGPSSPTTPRAHMATMMGCET